ncbi:hypothetical protein ACTJI2_07605 [Pseudoxanthomonas sp. 22568]|jgi:hypothetical protein|uniref:hypothetical protein n=1 Tax=Pseudoxanthomonas TaxID=83618 RepID=UPI00178330C4|nr:MULTISPECIES: hypothetical protein [Pseudoxanthomonas]MBD9378777.1 hypothetical protein [Pseudoxanthomonas sp. PXM04]MCL6713370.1 hypothetical protein [Pseudomonas sp. R2.Fl]
MNAQVELNLALILFLPWFAILAALYWIYPRQPRGTGRRLFDTIALVLATALSAWGMHWGFLNADPNAGAIWKQVLATSVAYGLFLMVMTLAIAVRAWCMPASPARAR